MTRRPLIDPTPDLPLRFFGISRIERGTGNVYAATVPATHGGVSRNREVLIGHVERAEDYWAAFSEGGLRFTGYRQQDAAQALLAWYQERERAHGGRREREGKR